MRNNVQEPGRLVGVMIVVIVFILMFLFVTESATEDYAACRHPLDAKMEIFMRACIEEGNYPGECYWTYVKAEHGGDFLNMPTRIT